VLTSLAYQPDGHALRTVVPLVDRTIYPADVYPDGQWDYYNYYTTNFEPAVADLDSDLSASSASIFRSGNPAGIDQVSPNAVVTRNGADLAPRTAHRQPCRIRLSGRQRTSKCWCSRSKQTASVHPVRGT
jgi:hypothetical protein